MDLHRLSLGRTQTLQLVRRDDESFARGLTEQAELFLWMIDGTGEVYLRQLDHVCLVKGATETDQARLEELFARRLPMLCWLASKPLEKGRIRELVIQTHEFAEGQVMMDPLELGLDEQAILDVRARAGKSSQQWGVPEAALWLSERLLLPKQGEPQTSRAILTGDLSGPGQQAVFRLHGDSLALELHHHEDGRLVVSRVLAASRQLNEGVPLKLLEGVIAFTDATVATAARTAVLATRGEYLTLWEQYNVLEREQAIAQAREAGWVRFERLLPLERGFRFFLSDPRELPRLAKWLQENPDTELEASAQLPEALMGEEGARSGRTARSFRGRTLQFRATGEPYIDLELPAGWQEEDRPPQRGFVYLAIRGSLTVVNRREAAKELITLRRNPMPQLADILEGTQRGTPRYRRETLRNSDLRRLFGGEPTEQQKRALELAINTPDIALIQGPPGTGKTQTIRAILNRLAEIQEASGNPAGRFLITSFQHVAVSNAANRAIVMGLPAYRIGRKGDSSDGYRAISDWREETSRRLEAHFQQALGQTPLHSVIQSIRVQARGYRALPTPPAQAAALLRRLACEAGAQLPPHLLDQVLAKAASLEQPNWHEGLEAEDRVRAIVAVRRLRRNAIAFEDDGPRNARQCMNILRSLRVLEPGGEDLLLRAAEWLEEGDVPFLDELTLLHDTLIDRLLPDRRPAASPTADPEINALFNQVLSELQRLAEQSLDGASAVLAQYLADIEQDPAGVEETIRSYSTVLAATCQQAVGNEMLRAKIGLERLAGESSIAGIEFDTVIVDEAARANPLDLFIPMAHARRRIILVGDHRQLPHLLEQDIERELRDTSRMENLDDNLRKSLFERLFLQLKASQGKDQIVRTITLDTQFRMHPVLGDFVSRAFYEAHGEQAIRSGRPAAEFEHHLPGYEGAVAAWLEVSAERGPERPGKSKSRPAEAKAIAAELQRLVEAAPDLSFGVIAFYQAQVQEIRKALEKTGLIRKTDEAAGDGTASWKIAGGRSLRLEIGTVDAFQGKEFDVVFLSMTRCNQQGDDTPEQCRAKYGHLMLENRLCVAMSRQQRLLVVAGAGAMLSAPGAPRCIPGLVEFYALTGGPHGKRL